MPVSRAVRSRLPAAAVGAAGWGAHQFTPLAVYRTREHWPAVPVATMFTTCLLGLPPGQLLGGPAGPMPHGPAPGAYRRRRRNPEPPR
ncbi:hypothetical protein [Streptomyces sp. NPDC059349]|uniref:hypothetical protein n=1 Tax=Streptomyces sp. NPDC059349 TaxID=3346808 RepID=UPI0036B11618